VKYFILSLCFLCSFSASAQQKNVNVDKMANKMAKLYDLNATQLAQYKVILESKVLAINEMKKSPSSAEQDGEARMKIEEDYGDQFEEILNPDQKLLYQKHRAMIPTKKKLMSPSKVNVQEAKKKQKTSDQ